MTSTFLIIHGFALFGFVHLVFKIQDLKKQIEFLQELPNHCKHR